MKKYRPSLLLTTFVMSLLVLGCSGDVEESPGSDPLAVCLQGEPFIDDGMYPVESSQTGDAHTISALRWEEHDGCERFVIDFITEDGNPAFGVGEITAEVRRDLGVVRINLPSVERVDTGATDADFDGLVDAAYVVRSEEGRWLYVDLHLAEEAEVHIAVIEEPGRVFVDLRPGGPPIPPPAAAENHIVVLEPRTEEVTYPFDITGYARTFEANVVARIEREGEEILETFTTATSWVDAWGYYSITIDNGPSGPIVLHVGEYSARDGTWSGVRLSLEAQ